MQQRDTPATWEENYRIGQTPWDTGITPPEVVTFWQQEHRPRHGLAFDLGCGGATNVAFLAQQGLSVIGIDFVGLALLRGTERLRLLPADVCLRTQLVQADVTQLPFQAAAAGYILDIGCFHGLYPDMRVSYVQGVVENLAPDGFYHLYAFDRNDEFLNDPERRHRGVDENEVVERFAPWLEVVEIVRARPDRHPCRWYLLRKP